MTNSKHQIEADKIRNQFSEGDAKRDAEQKTPDDVMRFDNILYGYDKEFQKWQLLDVYRPKGAEKSSVLAKLPVIVIVHGGAWVYGDKDVYQFYGMSLARRGFAVVNYSYRLAPEKKFPASMQDTEKVFRWIVDNAEQYGFDTQNVFAVGDSAGAHLLALYASAVTNAEYAKNFPFIGKKNLTLRGIALNCGKYKMDGEQEKELQTELLVEILMPKGGTSDELHLIDATAHVAANFPPSFVMTCRGDFLVRQAPLITNALKTAGVPYEYRCYGTDEKALWHVFHCDMRLPEADICNNEECDFFKKLMK